MPAARGRSKGPTGRLGGIFAARLLTHINHLKEDRIKTGADLIVQAARGYRSLNSGGWIKQYKPCRLILFEDLARYRFRIDRSRFENSQLMRWAHRKILDQTTMQADVYGIAVDCTSAGFSSRFHSRTNAPGLRVHRVSSEDLLDPFKLERIQ